MVVRVLFFGVLKDIMGCAEELREIPENMTLGALSRTIPHGSKPCETSVRPFC